MTSRKGPKQRRSRAVNRASRRLVRHNASLGARPLSEREKRLILRR